jgi:hypothetical protein
LIEKVIKAGGMEYCNKCAIPAETTQVGADIDGESLKDSSLYVPSHELNMLSSTVT